MKILRVPWILLALTLPFSTALTVRGEIPQSDFQRLHEELRPADDETWRTIPWKTSVLDAQHAAGEQQKPIFIWAMDGHPLGCTWNNGVLDRASTFADAEIVKMLKSDFVPVAIDQAYQRRQKDTEGEFYRKIAGQSPRSDFRGTTQGFYIATPSGDLLLYNNNRHPEKVRRLMKEKLAEFASHADAKQKTAAIEAESHDPRWDLHPPEGGMIVRVHGKVLDGYEPTDNRWKKIFQGALSRDNMWITAEEQQSIVAGNLPATVAQRLARNHLMDGTRGEPLMWKDEEVRNIDLKLRDGKLVGTAHLETKDSKRGYKCELQGIVESDGENVTRFDIVAMGKCWGDGPYTKGGPKGKFTLALAFSLADGNDIADAVPPQGCKGWLDGYMR